MKKISDELFSQMVEYAKKLAQKESDTTKVIEKTIEEFNVEDDGTLRFQLTYILIK